MDMEALATCDICMEEFDHDTSIADRRSSNLPVLSARCPHRICYSCVVGIKSDRESRLRSGDGGGAVEWIECPTCRKGSCFNAEDPVVDLWGCGLLAVLRGRGDGRVAVGNVGNDNLAGDEEAPLPLRKADDTLHGGQRDQQLYRESVEEGEEGGRRADVSLDNRGDSMAGASNEAEGSINFERDNAEALYRGICDGDDQSIESKFSELSVDDIINTPDISGVIAGSNNTAHHSHGACSTEAPPRRKIARTEEDELVGSGAISASCLISREQLHCLTGGVRGGFRNPLGVGTPMGFCGGRAVATANGRVHHICIKECMNHPLPRSAGEEFLLYRGTRGRGPLVRDIQLLADMRSRHLPIPIFWEPADQKGTRVAYVGHWRISSIEDYSGDPITYMGMLRCALVRFKFAYFDRRWASIIRRCHDKSNDEIKSINWDGEGGEDSTTSTGRIILLNHKSDVGSKTPWGYKRRRVEQKNIPF